MTLTLRPLPCRLMLAALVVVGALMLGWKIVTASLSEVMLTYVERTPSLSAEARNEAAGLAARYAPDSPMARLQHGAASLALAVESGDNNLATVSVGEIREAATLSPFDYRVRLALGRALERTGEAREAGETVNANGVNDLNGANDANDAREAFDRAVEFAPRYFETHWALGNHLLRQGDREGAFAAMRQSLLLRPSALPLVFDYAWSAWNGDVSLIINALDPHPPMLARMAILLVRRNRPDDGLSVWQRIDGPAPSEARQMVAALVDNARHGDAWRIWSSAVLPEKAEPAPGSLLANPGFEERIQVNSSLPFYSWRVSSGNGVRVTVDRQNPHEGLQSLRVSFDLDGGEPLTIASQTIPVEPNRSYCLTIFTKIEELRSLGPPVIEVFDAAHPELAYAATVPLVGDFADWTQQTLKIRTTKTTEAVTIRLQRPLCSDPHCSIEGRLWLDSLVLGACAANTP